MHKHHCTDDYNCPENKSKLIIEKGECVEDDSKDDFRNYEFQNEDNDKTIENIKSNLNNSILEEEEIEEIKNGNDMILTENNELKISLKVSDNQKNKSKNISSINLGECENKLKEFYNISKNESLLILIIEEKKENMKIPRIYYGVYYPLNRKILSKLDLNKCDNINIEVYIPIEIDNKDIDKYNFSSNFYKDICYIYSTNNGTDMILKDRKEEYINNDMGACEESCNFTDYNYQNKKAICSCEVNKTLYSFTNIKNFMNLNVMKCYEKLFCKNGLLYFI